mmetsp:Transcript_19211/g.41858  ORF Transcript_19211/g.41858 Transcript_19211/m.41858 type:complete len:218 (+) Transcript_19211:140-793(+)
MKQPWIEARPAKRSASGKLGDDTIATSHQRVHEEEEGHLRCATAVLVDISRGDPCPYHGVDVVLWHPLKDALYAQVLNHQRRNCISQNLLHEQIGLLCRHVLEMFLNGVIQLVDLHGELPSQLGLRDSLLLVAAPYGIELLLRVVLDDGEDLLNVGRVELRRLASLRVVGHELSVVLWRQRQCSENLQGRAVHTALVCRGVLEHVNTGLLQRLPGTG